MQQGYLWPSDQIQCKENKTKIQVQAVTEYGFSTLFVQLIFATLRDLFLKILNIYANITLELLWGSFFTYLTGINYLQRKEFKYA